MDSPEFTDPVLCQHCGNVGLQEILSSFERFGEEETPKHQAPWQDGYVYQVLLCRVCDGVSLRRYYWHTGYAIEDEGYCTFEPLYPPSPDIPSGLTENVAKAFRSALKLRGVDANAYGVLLGRVLELVCIDRSAKGKMLAAKLEDLAKRDEIPPKLVDVAKQLRRLRNVGAHPDLGELDETEAPILERLTRAILEYVYTAPELAQIAQDAVARIKKNHS